MSIDLRVAGDHRAVRQLAEWLAPGLADPVLEADLDLAYAWADSQHYWTGRSGDAFRDAATEIRKRSADVPSFLRDIAEVLRAYANRLERGQEMFDDYRSQAARAGLAVMGHAVLPPATWLQRCPSDGAPERELKEWNRHVASVETYNRLAGYVGTWWGDLEAWIAEHLAPLGERVDGLLSLAKLVDGLNVGNDDIIGGAFTYTSARVERNMSGYRETAQRLQADADGFAARLRSGNPALRAAAEAANPREIRASVAAINEAIGKVTKFSKVIPVAGGVVEVVSAGVEIANGGSPSSVGAGLLAGAGSGGLLAAALVSASVPPVGVAIAASGLGLVMGKLGTWTWEATLPIDVRESIDHFFTGPPVLLSGSTGTWAAGTR